MKNAYLIETNENLNAKNIRESKSYCFAMSVLSHYVLNAFILIIIMKISLMSFNNYLLM